MKRHSTSSAVNRIAMGCVLVSLSTNLPFTRMEPEQQRQEPVCENQPPPTDNEVLVARANNAFAFDLYAQLRQEPGNVFFSPYSLASALAMAWAGARGGTAAQIADVFHFGAEQGPIHTGFSELNTSLDACRDTRGWELSIASALWVQQDYSLLAEFLALTETYYDSAATAVDFVEAPAVAAAQINEWTRAATDGNIQEIVTEDDINEATRVLLANAVYFKGAWTYKFDPDDTQEGRFYLSGGIGTVGGPMMSIEDAKFRSMVADGFEMLELPYGDGTLTMLILLPYGANGLADLEPELSAENLDTWVGQLEEPMLIHVRLPKFSMRTDLTLADTLIQMGMPDAFEGGAADLSGMDGTLMLYLEDVLQSAWIDVNEEGTVAGAVTQALSIACSAGPFFEVDRPFLLLIRDTRSGAVLFLGRVEKPW